jgi:hypothetical protein
MILNVCGVEDITLAMQEGGAHLGSERGKRKRLEVLVMGGHVRFLEDLPRCRVNRQHGGASRVAPRISLVPCVCRRVPAPKMVRRKSV